MNIKKFKHYIGSKIIVSAKKNLTHLDLRYCDVNNKQKIALMNLLMFFEKNNESYRFAQLVRHILESDNEIQIF